MIKNKRGISPVIATVLLIVIVVVAAVIIFLALRGFKGEVITKFGEPIENACADVDLDVSDEGDSIFINNLGDVGVAKINIVNIDGTVEDYNIGLAPSRSTTITEHSGTPDSAIPILEGVDEDGFTAYHTCDREFFF